MEKSHPQTVCAYYVSIGAGSVFNGITSRHSDNSYMYYNEIRNLAWGISIKLYSQLMVQHNVSYYMG